jgi:hypothetical protein
MVEYLQAVLEPSNPVAAIGIIGVLLLLVRQLSQ